MPDLKASPAAAILHLKFIGFRVDVETNSLRAASRLESYFGQYLAAPAGEPQMHLRVVRARPVYDERRLQVWQRAPGTRPPKESYYDKDGVRYILKNRTGMLITLSERAAAIVGDVDRHLNQAVNLIGTLFGLSLLERGYIMLHASGVVREDSDEATIFLGNSGSGKSSLALQLIEQGGFDYLSNDRVLLKATRDSVHVVGLPKKPRVNPGTLLASARLARLLPRRKRTAYGELDPDALWNLEDKHDVDVGRSLGARERLDGRLVRVFSLEWKPSGRGLKIEPLVADEALAAMKQTAKDFGPFDLRREQRNADREQRRVLRAVEFAGVSGRADPALLARRLAAMGSPLVSARR